MSLLRGKRQELLHDPQEVRDLRRVRREGLHRLGALHQLQRNRQKLRRETLRDLRSLWRNGKGTLDMQALDCSFLVDLGIVEIREELRRAIPA